MNPFIPPLRLDITGRAPGNTVVGEYHDASANNGSVNRAFVLDKGHFFDDETLVVRDLAGFTLKRGFDYKTAYLHAGASILTGRQVCAVIIITNPNAGSEFYVDAQMVGGDYCNVTSVLLRVLQSLGNTDGATVEWTYVSNRPVDYNPVGHRVKLWDIFGFEPWTEEIERMTWAVMLKSTNDNGRLQTPMVDLYAELRRSLALVDTSVDNHIANKDRPHSETLLQIGLDLVQNYPRATVEEAGERTHLRSYMTPIRTHDSIATGFIEPLNNHIQSQTNPHSVTPEQLDAYTGRAITQALQLKLKANAAAEDTTLFDGKAYEVAQAALRYGASAGQIVSERLVADRLGLGAAPGTLLVGDGRWVSTASLFELYRDRTSNKTIYIGYAGTNAQAKATINATFTDIVAYPVDTIILYSEAREATVVSGNGTLHIVSTATNLAIRIASGWQFAI